MLVLGNHGQLGSSISSQIHSQAKVLVIDEEDNSVSDLRSYTQDLTRKVVEFLQEGDSSPYLDAIICTTGNIQPDPVKLIHPNDEIKNIHELAQQGALAHAETMSTMLQRVLFPVSAASFVAQNFMTTSASSPGLMVVIGSLSALSPTPGFAAHGMTYSAIHHLVQTLGASTGRGTLETKKVRDAGRRVRQHQPGMDHLSVVGVLPTVKTNNSEWAANPDDIAKEIGKWIVSPYLRPHSGSLVKVYPGGEGTLFEMVR